MRILSLNISTVLVIHTIHWLQRVLLRLMHAHAVDTACERLACLQMRLPFTGVCIVVCIKCLQPLAPALQRPSAMHTFTAPQLQTSSQHAIPITLLAGEHSIVSLGSQLSSAQVPADSTTAASMKPAGHTNPAEKKPQHRALAAEDTPQHDPTAAEETPITPLQSQPSLPQHSLYTPSDSESRSQQHPFPTTATASKLTGLAADRSDASQNGARPSIREAQFMKSSRGLSSELGSDSTQQQPQLRPAVAKPESDSEAFSDPLDPRLSPPQSRPSSPECHTAEGTDKGSDDHAVTHVNGYFDKSDEDNSSSSRPELSDQGSEEEGEEEAGRSASRSKNRSRLGTVGNLAQSLEVILFYGISVTRTSMQLYFLYPLFLVGIPYHQASLCSLLVVHLFVCHTYLSCGL